MHKLTTFFLAFIFLAVSQVSFAEEMITPKNLGPFELSVKKFNDKVALDKHHDHLLEEALNPKNSILVRYTYALLLGINEPTPLTRDMAIQALDKLEKDPALTPSDRQTIINIRNLMLYQKQHLKT